MKNQHGDDVEHFECDCHDPGHAISFMLSRNKDSEPDLFLHVFLDRDTRSFFRRLWEGFKYAFKIGSPCKYGHFGEWQLSRHDAERLVVLAATFAKEYDHVMRKRPIVGKRFQTS